MPYFDENMPYYGAMKQAQFPWAVDIGISQLGDIKRRDPQQYADPKGTPFYFMAIAAFASHDYQTATFLFDAAVSEDVHHHPNNNDTPALRFMRLDQTTPHTAAQEIIGLLDKTVAAALKNYGRRAGSKPLGLDDLRERFLDHLERPHLRNLTTTFVSFLAEWDYRSKMIDLPSAEVSREPFFTHLFRGCLLFESLLRDQAPLPPPPADPPKSFWSRLWWLLSPPPVDAVLSLRTRFCRIFCPTRTASYTTLGYLLRVHRKKLDLSNNLRTSSSSFEEIVSQLQSNEPLRAAIQCTAKTRNILGHDLAWAVQSLDRERYDLLASNIAASCLHAIACLYVPAKS